MKLLKIIWAVSKMTLMMWAFFFLLTVFTVDIQKIGWLKIAGISFAYTFFFVLMAIFYFLYLKPKVDAEKDTD